MIQSSGIPPTTKPGTRTQVAHPRRQAGSFILAEPAAAYTQAEHDIVATTGLEAVHLGSLLAMQEAGPETPRDRAARRHGQQMLDLLRDLQLAALSAATDPRTLPRLIRLAAAIPPADDPALGAVMQAIAVRAAVELARRDLADTSMGTSTGFSDRR